MWRNLNHVDRVVWACWRDDLAENAARLERLTGVGLQGPHFSKALGAHVCVSNAAGLQIMAPEPGAGTAAAQALRAKLERSGEGVAAVVFGVPDLAEAQARLGPRAADLRDLPLAAGDEPWAGESGRIVSGVACEAAGVSFVFAQIDYRDGLFRVAADTPGVVRNNDRVDHVAWLCSPENLEAMIAKLGQLGGTPLDGPVDLPAAGLRIGISWDTGLEVVSPLPGSDRPAALETRRMLRRRGEGIYAVLFGVPDMEAALVRAREAGYEPGVLIQGGDPNRPWAGKYTKFLEARIGEEMNTDLMYCVTEYPAPDGRSQSVPVRTP
jgi:hypothetical protein